MNIVKPKIIIFDWNGTLVSGDKNNYIKPLPHAGKVLAALNNCGVHASVVSNTYSPFLKKIVKKYRMEKYFLNVIGTKGEVTYRKPSKEVIDYAMIGADVEDVNCDTVWMVGDSVQDIQTAYNANIRPVIFGEQLLKSMLRKEGLEKNRRVLYFKNHLELLNLIKGFENDNSEILEN